ncbi:MAG: FliM/FliN family flagellar motor switch protein [Candidatus Latescibacterota bacterium]
MPEDLTDDELRRLLSSVGPERAGVDLSRTPLAYDFRRPQRVNKEQIRLLESLHEQFARTTAATLSAAMRMVVDVDVAFVDQALYHEFVLSLPSPCSAYSFVMDPPGAAAVLAFAPEVLMAIIDRAFGGRGGGFAGDPRPLTQIEAGIAGQLVGRLLRDLEATWEPVRRLTIGDVALETNPELIHVADASEPVLLVALETHAPHAGGLVHLCYPLGTLEPLLPRAHGPGARLPGARSRPQAARPTPSPLLAKVRVPAVVQLASGRLALRELTDLRVGDIIKLDTPKDDPAVVFLGGRPKFTAKAGLDGRHRAARILRVLAADEEDLFQ